MAKPRKIKASLAVKGPRGTGVLFDVWALDTGKLNKQDQAIYEITPVKGSGSMNKGAQDLVFCEADS